MQNIIEMSSLLRIPQRSILSLPVFPVRTYRLLITKIETESKEIERDYGDRWQGLRLRLSLHIWFLKTLRSCSRKDLNMSYETFPISGIMRNGIVGELRTSGSRIIAGGYTLLPTPIRSDCDAGYCNHRALLNYYINGHQRRLIYECQLAGLKNSEIIQLYREIMSFSISHAKLRRSETQLCLW